MLRLKYGNTNTFYLAGSRGGLLIDTDYAGTLPAFFTAIKENRISVQDIAYVLATHYHPDHIGLISELTALGVRLLLIDVQRDSVHASDAIFAREKHLRYTPVDETQAVCISCAESRAFLRSLGLMGEIISTPSHSRDSISLITDSGDCFVGDLEPYEYLAAYDENEPLRQDWARILSFRPRRIYYAHANEKDILPGEK